MTKAQDAQNVFYGIIYFFKNVVSGQLKQILKILKKYFIITCTRDFG